VPALFSGRENGWPKPLRLGKDPGGQPHHLLHIKNRRNNKMNNFFKSATKVNLFKVGRNIGVTSSNSSLLGSIEKTLKTVGFVCNVNADTKTIIVTNTERFLPPVYFLTEVKEAIIKSGYTLRRGARIAADFETARLDSPELNGSFSNVLRSLEANKTAIACA